MGRPDESPEQFIERQVEKLLDIANACDALAADGGSLDQVNHLRDWAEQMRAFARAELGRAAGSHTERAMSDRFTPDERDALLEAAILVELLWDFDAERGLRDSRGDSEYMRSSPARRIREMLGEAPEGEAHWTGES